jgi:hypothetical protein
MEPMGWSWRQHRHGDRPGGIEGAARVVDAVNGRALGLARLARWSRAGVGLAVPAGARPAGDAGPGSAAAPGGPGWPAPPVRTLWTLGADRCLRPVALAAVRGVGLASVLRVAADTGLEIRLTGDRCLLTPAGWRQLDDLGPGAEVAMPWSQGEVYWGRLAAIEPAGLAEVFEIDVDPPGPVLAGGFLVSARPALGPVSASPSLPAGANPP